MSDNPILDQQTQQRILHLHRRGPLFYFWRRGSIWRGICGSCIHSQVLNRQTRISIKKPSTSCYWPWSGDRRVRLVVISWNHTLRKFTLLILVGLMMMLWGYYLFVDPKWNLFATILLNRSAHVAVHLAISNPGVSRIISVGPGNIKVWFPFWHDFCTRTFLFSGT